MWLTSNELVYVLYSCFSLGFQLWYALRCSFCVVAVIFCLDAMHAEGRAARGQRGGEGHKTSRSLQITAG